MFQLFDWYSATGLVLFWFCFWECVAFSWGYGADFIYEHIEDMVGYKINVYLKFCWKFVTPGVILVRYTTYFPLEPYNATKPLVLTYYVFPGTVN